MDKINKSVCQKGGVHIIDFLLICYIMIGALNLCLITEEEINWFLVIRWGMLCLCYVIARCLVNKRWMLWGIGLAGAIEAIWALSQQIGWVDSNHSIFDVTGTLGNPGQLAGFLSVALTVMFGLYLLYRQRKFIKWLILSLSLLMIFVLVLSDSRTGWVAALAGSSFVWRVWGRIKRTNLLFKISIGILGFLLCAGAYYYKKDSADGRLFIWRIATDMIADAPILGHGIGAFGKKYMYYQAQYFESYPLSEYIKLADNVIYPYNEFLHVGVEMGMLGILLVVLIIIALAWRVPLQEENMIYMGGFIALMVFSMFSYPSYVLLLMLLFPVLLGGIVCRREMRLFSTLACKYAWWGVCGFTACLLGKGYYTFYLLEKNVEKLYSSSSSDMVSAEKYIEMHYDDLKAIPGFLDLYAQYCYKTFPVPESLPVLKDAAIIVPTSELFCDLGNLYKDAGDMKRAVECYSLASYMTPNRLLPKYELFVLYQEIGDTLLARQIGETILSMVVKVESTETLKIKGGVKRYLEKE